MNAETGGNSPSGLVAILRGVRPTEVCAIADAIIEAGIGVVEVPLNSPDPFNSIARLAAHCGDAAIVGAGTVLSPDAARRVGEAGGRLVVMPHADVAVIRAAVDAKLWCVPGVSTPTEAFAALGAGAHALKAFPAELITPPVLKAWMAILPKGTDVLPVGGITPERMADYVLAGATGFGLGSALYRPGDAPAEVGERARRFVLAWFAIEAGDKR
jgi:2-dehydro-3-deoxyphosphogalactonate aldolase